MKIRNQRTLHGPNVWAACPAVELELDLRGLNPTAIARLQRFSHELLGTEPAAGEVGVAEAIVAGAKKLQEIAGVPVSFTAVQATSEPGMVRAAVEFSFAPLGEEAVAIAWRMLTSDGPAVPTDDEMAKLKAHEYEQRYSPSVATTVVGAKALGIPVMKLAPEYAGYLVLGHGSKQRRVRWSEPDAISGVARLASTDKYLTNQLLRSIGVPVPRGKLIAKVEEAWPAALEVGLPVVVKPYNCDLQTGVSLDLTTQDRVEAAYLATVEHASWALVERFAPGIEHRVVVVGERVVAVTRVDPPKVVGDGVSTIAQLVETVNKEPRRCGDDPPLSKIKLDDEALGVLAAQGYSVDSVLPANKVVLARRQPPYFKNGGTLTDLTDVIHPTVVAHCVAASKMMQIPMAGLDVVAVDITKPLEEQEGIVCEVNANPGLWLHLAPWADSPRPVGQEMVAWMFPPGNDARIPTIALVGDATGVVKRELAALLSNAGLRVGIAGRDEMSAAGRPWPVQPGTPQDRAHVLLRDPNIDAAIFVTDADELLEHGFATDRCDVAILASPPTPNVDFVKALTNALGPKGTYVTGPAWTAVQLAVPPDRFSTAAVDSLAHTAVAILDRKSKKSER